MHSADRNYWNSVSTNEDFLSYLRNTSKARNFCRSNIKNLIELQEISSITEIGFGGLNEFISLNETFKNNGTRYTGLDWTAKFVDCAKERFPENNWYQYDVTQNNIDENWKSDIVYSQHVLEHCPGLEPGLSNMLRLANKALLYIFFIPPTDGRETIGFEDYPLYHNVYSIEHIYSVCEHHGFSYELGAFHNDDPDCKECKYEVVLLAKRNN